MLCWQYHFASKIIALFFWLEPSHSTGWPPLQHRLRFAGRVPWAHHGVHGLVQVIDKLVIAQGRRASAGVSNRSASPSNSTASRIQRIAVTLYCRQSVLQNVYAPVRCRASTGCSIPPCARRVYARISSAHRPAACPEGRRLGQTTTDITGRRLEQPFKIRNRLVDSASSVGDSPLAAISVSPAAGLSTRHQASTSALDDLFDLPLTHPCGAVAAVAGIIEVLQQLHACFEMCRSRFRYCVPCPQSLVPVGAKGIVPEVMTPLKRS